MSTPIIFIIVSNAGFALVTLFLYFRYSHFRISSSIRIRDLKKRLEELMIEKEKMAEAMKAETKAENDQVKKLLRDLESFRKEKEEEMRLRLEAEKQIEIAMNQIAEVQRRMADWKLIQDAAINDSKEAIYKVGSDLYEKLSKVQQEEIEGVSSGIETKMKNVYDYLENISKNVEEVKNKNFTIISSQVSKSSEQAKTVVQAKTNVLDELTRKKLNDVKSLMKDSGFKVNQDYVLAENLDEEKAKSMLCDLIFVRDNIGYFIDFKSNHYFHEYEKLRYENKEQASINLKQRLDKYLSYISNPKYLSILQKLASDIGLRNFSESKVIFALDSREEISILKEIGYFAKTKELNLTVLDTDGVSDLAL